MTDLRPILLDRSELAVLAARATVTPAMCSPILDAVADRVPEEDDAVVEKLAAGGWLSDTDESRLSDDGLEAIHSLLRPTVSGRAVLGTRREIGTLGVYAAEAGGPYVALSESIDGGGYRIAPGRPYSDFANAVTAQLLLGPMGISVTFSGVFDPEEFATVAAILDWRTRAMLLAMIDRAPYPDVRCSSRELWEMLEEGRLADDPAWAVTLFRSILPQVTFGLSEDQVGAAIDHLADAGLVTPAGEAVWRLAGALEDLADGLQPFGSYAAVHLEVWDGDEPREAVHYAFVRGPFALAAIRPMVDDGRRVVTMEAITDVDLADLLTDLSSAPAVVHAELESPVCPECGTPAEPGQRFCSKCGSPLEDSPRSQKSICRQCGADIDDGRDAFCWACGAPVAQSGDGGGDS